MLSGNCSEKIPMNNGAVYVLLFAYLSQCPWVRAVGMGAVAGL